MPIETEGRKAGQPLRIHLAAEDFITRFPPGGPYRFRIETPFERNWRARIAGDQIRATHPGTALLFQDRYYEVVRSEPGENGLFHYYLAPWQDDLVIRQAAELSPTTSEQAALDHQTKRLRRKQSFLLLIATPFLGLLPRRDQLFLEKEHGTDALLSTAVSAVLIGLPASALTILGMVASFGASFGAPFEFDFQRFLWPAMYFVGESMFRLWGALSASEPIGSVPVVLVAESVRAIRDHRSGS